MQGLSSSSSSSTTIPTFPANVGTVTEDGYWTTQCEYYDLEIKETGGLPKYITEFSERKYTKLKFIKKLGEGGSGLILRVWDSKENPIVLKIALDDHLSVQERTVGAFINRWILAGRRSPNFVTSLFELICQGLPPAKYDWKGIVELMQREWVPRFIEGASHPYYRKRPAAISYLGLELGTSGDLFKFGGILELGDDMVISLSFQILFGLAALHETNFVHKDVQDQNIVVSEFHPRVDPVPLYRCKFYLDEDWIYADPYLTQIDADDDERSEIGDETHLFYTAKFIDYGGSRRLPANFPKVVFMRGISGVIQSVSPEALFIDRRPLELLLPTEQWQTQKHPMVPYSKATDVWAAGMVITSIALGGAHLFIESQDGPELEWLFPAPDQVIKQMKLIYNNVDSPTSGWMLKYVGASMNDGIHSMWNMVEGLGLPTNEDWPGIEHSLLFKVILAHKRLLRYGTTGGWIIGSPEGPDRIERAQLRFDLLVQTLGPEGFSMLFDNILIWNSANRAEALLLIAEDPLFKRIREAGEIRHQVNGDAEKNNTWGFQENWWILQENKAKLEKNNNEKISNHKQQQQKKMGKGKEKEV